MSDRRALEQVVDGAGADHLAAVPSRPGPEVDHVVRLPDGLLVVLHHHHRVAQVAQAVQGGQEAVVVALVQADARFVEHVEDPDQAGADLGGQPDALGLAAGQGPALAVQGQVVQPHVDQEPQAAADLLEDLVGDALLLFRQVQVRREGRGARTDIRQKSTMERPPTRQASDSGRSRRPSQSVQGWRLM